MSVVDDFVSNCQQLMNEAIAYAAAGVYIPDTDKNIRTVSMWNQTWATAMAQSRSTPLQRPPEPAPSGAPTPIEAARSKA